MKKSILSIAIALVALSASAQIEKGTILINGASNLGFQSYNEDAGDGSQMDLAVKGGYFFMDNLAIGLSLGYSKWSEADDGETAIGLFGRYYVNGKIILGAGFESVKLGDFSGSGIGLELGYAIFANNAVAIEPGLNFTSYGGDLEGSSFGLQVGISVYLGRGE